MFKVIMIFTIAFLSVPQAVQAQNLACPNNISEQKIDLLKALKFSMCANPDLASVIARKESAQAALGEARSSYYPSLTFDTSVQNLYTEYDSNINGDSNQDSIIAELSLDYLLYDFGQREANVENFIQQLEAASFGHNDRLQRLLFEVTQAYYNLLSAEADVSATWESEKSSLAAFEAATLRHKVGQVSIVDKLQAETAYAQNQLDHARAENLRETSKGKFLNLLNMRPENFVSLEKTPLILEHHDIDENISVLIDEAIQNRPDLKKIAAEEKAVSAQLDREKRSRLPKINAYASQDDRHYSGTTMLEDSKSSTIGLRLSVPLFTGFQTTYRIKGVEADLRTAIQDREALQSDISLDVWTSWQNYKTAKKILITSEKLMDSSAKAEEAALARYKAGEGNILELLDAQASLADARRQNISAEYDLMITRLDVARALGQITLSSFEKGAIE